MKSYIHILSIITFVLFSCEKEPLLKDANATNSEKVTLDLSVIVPDASYSTKNMGEEPSLNTLHLAVFDENGYLAEYVPAELSETTQNGQTIYKYTVTLSLSDKQRTIHWIGNGPDRVPYGTEESVILSLKTQHPKDAYWYRKVITKIDKKESNASTQSGESVFTPSDALVTSLSNIPLIRNFAKIKLNITATNFTLTKYAVINTYKTGYIAAYNSNNGSFVEYMEDNTQKTYTKLTGTAPDGEGYDATTSIIPEYIVPENNDWKAWWNENQVDSENSYYVYEREKAINNPPYIIAYGIYTDNGESTEGYYKINLKDSKENHFPLIRNFLYTVNLTAVNRKGYETIEEAMSSPGSGDVSTAIETEGLIFMSDGAASLEISYTDTVVLSNKSIKLRVNFHPDINQPDKLYPYSIPEGYTETGVIFTLNNDYGLSGAAISNITETLQTTGNNNVSPYILVNPTVPEDMAKSQSITVMAKYKAPNSDILRTIQRKVKITVMKEQEIFAACNPTEIPAAKGSTFNLDITIPAGLPKSIFPLDFKVESQDLAITPDTEKNEYMTLETGKSISGSTKPAYYYIRTLSREEYNSLENVDGKKTLSIHLKTIKAIKEGTNSNIFVSNLYFDGIPEDSDKNHATTGFFNYIPNLFQNAKIEQLPDEKQMKIFNLSFEIVTNTDMPDGSIITILLDNLEPVESNILRYKGTENNKAKYEYTPASFIGTHSFKLRAINTQNKTVSATLGARYFENVSIAKSFN